MVVRYGYMPTPNVVYPTFPPSMRGSMVFTGQHPDPHIIVPPFFGTGPLITPSTGTLGSVFNFQIIRQGGSTNGQFPVTNPLSQITLQWGAASGPVAQYFVYRGINGATKTFYAAVPLSAGSGGIFTYTDNNATNFYSAANINEGPTDPLGLTTWYDYDVYAVDSSNNLGPAPTQFSCLVYYNGVSFCSNNDLSFGMASGYPQYSATDPLGTTAIACKKSGGPGSIQGLQSASFNPLSFNYGLEVNMFRYLQLELMPGYAGQNWDLSWISRSPVGDVFPHFNLPNFATAGQYGGPPVVGQYSIYTFPLSIFGFGENLVTATINNGVLNVTNILSGSIGVIDPTCWVSVPGSNTTPGASGGVWVSASPNQNGIGTYNVTMNGNTTQGGQAGANPPNVLTPQTFVIHRSNSYKSNVKDVNGPANNLWYCRKMYFTRTPSPAL